MEPQQQQTQQQLAAANEGDGGSGSSKGGFVCRQSSTRWTPTTDQIRILKDLYYNNGVRSPSAEQIQRISARLRQYGKIEGKNVFYWFQNHKARERQKKRFTAPSPPHHHHVPPPPMQQIMPPPATNWKPLDHHQSININHNNISLAPGVSSASPSSGGVIASVGQMGMNYAYGSMTMEKSFRECSISSAAGGGGSTSGGGGGGGSISHNFGSWVGVDPYSSPYFDKTKPCPLFDGEIMMDEEDDQYQEVASPEIETLPLFPMHGEDVHGFGNLKQPTSGSYYSGWYHRSNDGAAANTASRTSLELSLNSYGHSTPEYYF